ncbi:hypothetical protein [Actinacidiphila oryziradicis]|uniref:Uncharacterized protein n=1 Tax=Actinacidiphila oryziradicis TaxID=2571141 RepID=A0A4U0RCV9_9ACTN|nr:hypothetical protein [Actinacidiphila oryziradicis]TJZ93181.1 hypothetical protein FCI23_54675 [Actinacidiphila oryziradicis]
MTTWPDASRRMMPSPNQQFRRPGPGRAPPTTAYYGALPTSEGLAGADAVQRIVYLNSFLLDVGESMLGNRGGAYPPHWGVNEEEKYVLMLNAEHGFRGAVHEHEDLGVCQAHNRTDEPWSTQSRSVWVLNSSGSR